MMELLEIEIAHCKLRIANLGFGIWDSHLFYTCVHVMKKNLDTQGSCTRNSGEKESYGPGWRAKCWRGKRLGRGGRR